MERSCLTMGRRIVWVLGSGSSVALGGPTLASLLSAGALLNLEARYAPASYPKLFDDNARLVHRLYHCGRRWPEGTFAANDHKPGEMLWTHAEEFLDYLDTAARSQEDHGGPYATRLRLTAGKWLDVNGLPPIKHLSAAARRLVAAECCAFLESADTYSERWGPYLRWAQSLTENDTVISFNYDRVPETLRLPAFARVILPDLDGNAHNITNICAILKLHGSVDWCVTENAIEQKDERFALSCDDQQLAIATPGPGKARDAQENFDDLWRLAVDSIQKATAVVFVGYRFPPTDSMAREKLLGALTANKDGVRCHVVLGTNCPNDVERLKALLTFALDHRPGTSFRADIRDHSLFAEDFFGVFNRDTL